MTSLITLQRSLCLLFLAGGLCFLPYLAQADGPVKDLEKALKSGKKTILFSGKENEDFTIKAGVSVSGVSLDKALIYGDIKLENGASLAHVTVVGRRIPITIAKGASVTLSDVTVKGGTDVGIFAPQGGGTLTVKNSRITKNRKGLYILSGKNLSITGNIISNNDEEGLDVREGTTGSIRGNQFLGNGEGGAEIIAGSARLVVEDNIFSGNKASGLALQAYSGAGKAPGSIRLLDNTFAGNSHFGLICDSPSRGGAGSSFFRQVVQAIDNTFQNNKRGTIDPNCAVVNRRSASETPIQEAVSVDTLSDEAKSAALEEERVHLGQAVRTLLTETLAKLHAEEQAFEDTLNQYATGKPWYWRWFAPAIMPEALPPLVAQVAALNEKRTLIASLSSEALGSDLASERDVAVAESLRRMEELRQYFERLQKPRPLWWWAAW